MSEELGTMKIEQLENGKKAIIAQIRGGSFVVLGYIGPSITIQQGGASRVGLSMVL